MGLGEGGGKKSMYNIWIDDRVCDGCGICVSICPKKVLTLSKEINKRGVLPAVVVNKDRCTGCMLCELSCPQLAIFVEKVERQNVDN